MWQMDLVQKTNQKINFSLTVRQIPIYRSAMTHKQPQAHKKPPAADAAGGYVYVIVRSTRSYFTTLAMLSPTMEPKMKATLKPLPYFWPSRSS